MPFVRRSFEANKELLGLGRVTLQSCTGPAAKESFHCPQVAADLGGTELFSLNFPAPALPGAVSAVVLLLFGVICLLGRWIWGWG